MMMVIYKVCMVSIKKLMVISYKCWVFSFECMLLLLIMFRCSILFGKIENILGMFII